MSSCVATAASGVGEPAELVGHEEHLAPADELARRGAAHGAEAVVERAPSQAEAGGDGRDLERLPQATAHELHHDAHVALLPLAHAVGHAHGAAALLGVLEHAQEHGPGVVNVAQHEVGEPGASGVENEPGAEGARVDVADDGVVGRMGAQHVRGVQRLGLPRRREHEDGGRKGGVAGGALGGRLRIVGAPDGGMPSQSLRETRVRDPVGQQQGDPTLSHGRGKKSLHAAHTNCTPRTPAFDRDQVLVYQPSPETLYVTHDSSPRRCPDQLVRPGRLHGFAHGC
jgi:hypothetical protein